MSENYTSPLGSAISLDFKGEPYESPLGSQVSLNFNEQAVVAGPTQYTFPISIYTPRIGTSVIYLQDNPVLMQGYNHALIGKPVVFNSDQYLYGKGAMNTDFGRPRFRNKNQNVLIPSIDAQSFGRPYAFNLRQYVRVTQHKTDGYGKPYLQGGVKYIRPSGRDLSEIRSLQLYVRNTTADRNISLDGIEPPTIQPPNVSPIIARPHGINSLRFGDVDIRNTAIIPDGIAQPPIGSATIWFHTRHIYQEYVNAYEAGYPTVFDPVQFIQTPSLVQSAVFGDVKIRNKTGRINPSSIYLDPFSPWAVIENSIRYYSMQGFYNGGIGASVIYNVTPSLFVKDIAAPDFNKPAIGHWLQEAEPSGADTMLIGRPIFIKTPELFPVGAETDKHGRPYVWLRDRILRLTGYSGLAAGEPTISFRYRAFRPRSISISVMGEPDISHGVREVIVNSFYSSRFSYDYWISRGTRYVEAVGIYSDKRSYHLVGRHQNISAGGFEATGFGERIIPISQSLYPIGAVGSWGLAHASLYIRYLLPFGYISVGQQFADRWGSLVVHNLRQYVFQTYDSNSGLAPPKWSDWTLIESRNRHLNVTGFLAQKFGYSQTNNNASAILPKSIEAPIQGRFDVSMITYKERFVPAEGIYSEIISTWAVVYNAARVVRPALFDDSTLSVPSIINTRRYYERVGNFVSEDFGQLGMVSHRIRDVFIERRHSIEPPQINLPIVDLYTRYVTYRGYETAAYGTPSLSIHLRLLEPKWYHRDYFGDVQSRKVTPEVFINGHNSESLGIGSIRTEWSNVDVIGRNTQLIGIANIADRLQKIEIEGWLDSASAPRHVVVRLGTNPYVKQYVWLNDESGRGGGEGFGIEFNTRLNGVQIPSPGINQNVLYPYGFTSSRMGTALAYGNNLLPIGIGFRNIENGHRLTRMLESIDVSGGGIKPVFKVGTPSSTPHTIYAVMDAPALAVKNHVNRDLHYVKSEAVFGRPSFDSTIKDVYARGWNGSKVNEPTIDLYIRYVDLTNEGFRFSRFGTPAIPFSPITVEIRSGLDFFGAGKPSVSRPPYDGPRYITIRESIEPPETKYSRQDIQNLHRRIEIDGINSLRMGVMLWSDRPWMWQGLRIGVFVPMSISGGDLSLYGNAHIENMVRGVEAEGFDALITIPNSYEFRLRMTVKNTVVYKPTTTTVSVSAIRSSSAGQPEAWNYHSFVRPDGNSDQFRKGGYHA